MSKDISTDITRFLLQKNEIMTKTIRGRVYIVQCEHFFKIGYTAQAIKIRISAMSTGNPFPIKIIMAINFNNTEAPKALELALHDKYFKKRVSGEWFALDQSDISEIWKMYKGDGNTDSKMISKPFFPGDGPQEKYWKYRFLSKCDDFRKLQQKESRQHIGWESSLKFQISLNKKKVRRIEQLKKRNEGDIKKYVKKNKQLMREIEEIKESLKQFQMFSLFTTISDVLANYPAEDLNKIIIENTYPQTH